LANHFRYLTEIPLLHWRKPSINDAPRIRLEQRWLDICFPDPVSDDGKKMFPRLMGELSTHQLKSLLGDESNSVWHLMQRVLKTYEEVVCDVSKIL
jgi:hypothetical protein